MTTVKQRILLYIDSTTEPRVKFERIMNLSKGALANNGKINAESVSLLLLSCPDLSADWLMRGEGSMYKSDNAYNINNTQARDGNNIASGENASATMTQTQDPAMTTLIKNMMEQQSQELQAARKRIDELTDKLLNK